MYATKRRHRNFKRPPNERGGGAAAKAGAPTASNPSKRHRERLNGELETVASLLPFEPPVLTRLDKLSVLRLAVSFLQAKTHFQESLRRQYFPQAYYGGGGYGGLLMATNPPPLLTPADRIYASEHNIFKALGGFILILNENGEIYYTSENIETYLGFHQSDILHQPVFDMIHSEDREELRQQLSWTTGLPLNASFQDVCTPDGLVYLERGASARFRCLLDNTCGFLRIDIRGKLTLLHGLPACYLAGRSDPSVPVLGLLAICTPFVPPPSLDGPDTEPFLKTKHSLDFSLFSLDSKAKILLELEDKHLPTSFYTTVHHQDAHCLAEAHKEAVKNGASGLLVYRVLSRRSRRVYWLQSSCRLFYKNGKPESIGCTHRLLTEVEGETLLEKRASLSAKLLSFDDSLLQSPKLLQSTAALTTTAAPALNHKLKPKRFRPPTVSTSFRDPALRGSSMTSIRSAAAALAASFPATPVSAPLPPYLPQLDSSDLRQSSSGSQNPSTSAWLPPPPKALPELLTAVTAPYYSYLQPSELYVGSTAPATSGMSPTGGGKFLSAQSWVLPTYPPASDIPESVGSLGLGEEWGKYVGQAFQMGMGEWSSGMEAMGRGHPSSSHHFPTPLPPYKSLPRGGMGLGGMGSVETTIPGFNFPISEVTNTLLGQ